MSSHWAFKGFRTQKHFPLDCVSLCRLGMVLYECCTRGRGQGGRVFGISVEDPWRRL